MKAKGFCTERRAKVILVIVCVFCLLTTLPTKFEYQLKFDEQCIRNCTALGPADNSDTPFPSDSIQYLPAHDIIVITKKNIPERNFNKTCQHNALPLSINSSNPPSVIYAPYYPVNISKDVVYDPNLIAAIPISNVSDVSELLSHRRVSRMALARGNQKATEMKQQETISFNKQPHKGAQSENFLGENDANGTLNETCCEKKFSVGSEATSLAKNQAYMGFMYFFSSIVFVLLPLVIIATFNCFLIRAVYKSQHRRKTLTNTQESSSLGNENRITLMLIGVVVLFLICQTPTAVFLIYYYFAEPVTEYQNNIRLVLGNIFNLLTAINASCNFLLYCGFSRKFRNTFKQLFLHRGIKRQNTMSLLSSTRNSQRFSPNRNGIRRNISEYRTPRNIETQSLGNGSPRSKSLMAKLPARSKSKDLLI